MGFPLLAGHGDDMEQRAVAHDREEGKAFARSVLCFKNVDQDLVVERVPCWCLHGVQPQGRHCFVALVTMKQFSA